MNSFDAVVWVSSMVLAFFFFNKYELSFWWFADKWVAAGILFSTWVVLLAYNRVMDEFMGTSGLSTTAVDAVNSTIKSLTPIASDWMPIIVIVAVLGIILALVLNAFGNYRNRQ